MKSYFYLHLLLTFLSLTCGLGSNAATPINPAPISDALATTTTDETDTINMGNHLTSEKDNDTVKVSKSTQSSSDLDDGFMTGNKGSAASQKNQQETFSSDGFLKPSNMPKEAAPYLTPSINNRRRVPVGVLLFAFGTLILVVFLLKKFKVL